MVVNGIAICQEECELQSGLQNVVATERTPKQVSSGHAFTGHLL